MSEAVAVVESVTPAPVVPALDSLESVSDYRTRRAAGEDGEAVEVKPEVVEPKPDVAAEPDPASEAGKALAAKKGSLQGRIDELTREKSQSASEAATARAEAAALKAELAALKVGKPTEPAKPAQPVTDPTDPEPDVNAFEDYAKFVKAQAAWEVRQAVKAERARQDGDARISGIAQAQTRVEAAAKAAHADFDDTIGAFVAAGGVFDPVSRDVILNHPLGHEIAYVLAKDKGLADRIAGAPSPAVAFLELGRVIAGIEGAAKPAEVKPEVKPAPVSAAPAPVQPVAAGEASAAGFDPAKSNSLAEFRKHRATL